MAGLPTYSELIALPLTEVRRIATENPTHIASQNALRELERQAKHAKSLARMGRRGATAAGMTKNRFSHSGPRVPTKRELK